MPRKPVVSRRLTYTELTCECRTLPEGEPVQVKRYKWGAYQDRRKAFRKINKELKTEGLYLVRISALEIKEEVLAMDINQFINLCKEDKTCLTLKH